MNELGQCKRILLKISGEAFGGSSGFGLDKEVFDFIARQIIEVAETGCQVCVVVGGGNFVRGSAFSEGGFDRTVADHMGMLGTVMNGLALQSAIETHGLQTRLQSGLNISEVAEPFIRRKAIRHLEKERVVVFAAGTGNPYFTTDTAAVLRALEVNADVLIKATKVDGIYDKDPKKFDDAVKFDQISYRDAIEKRLGVMDQTAFTMCEENTLPIIVLDMMKQGAIKRAVLGEKEGTLVKG